MGRLTPLLSSLFKRSFEKRFQMAKLTRVPLIGRAMEYAFFENDDIIILPKDEVAKASLERRRTIKMHIDESDFLDSSIRRIEPLVDVVSK